MPDTRESVDGTELRLGDIVELFGGTYNHATVKQHKDGRITFFRPYVQTADFSYTGGIICYIGIEEFDSPASQKYLRLRKGDPLK